MREKNWHNKMFKYDLKRCPICGEEAEFIIKDSRYYYDSESPCCDTTFTIGCRNHDCVRFSKTYEFKHRVALNIFNGLKIINDERAKAVNDWNKRVSKEGKDNG